MAERKKSFEQAMARLEEDGTAAETPLEREE